MEFITWKWLSIGVILLVINVKVESVEFVVNPQSASGIQGSTITLQCGINTEYRQGTHRIYWAFYAAPGAHTFLSVDRSIYSSISLSKRGRYTITGGTELGMITFDLQITNAQLEDNGNYECIIYDSLTGQRMTSPDPAQVVVVPYKPPTRGPICSINPPYPRPGVYVTFTCYTHGGLPRPTLTWRRNGINMISVLNSTEDAGLEIIQFKRYMSGYDNNATFTCTAESPAMGASKNCSITPFVIPIQVSVTTVQTVKVGQSAEFFCSASGVPEVNRYRWIIGQGKTTEKLSRSEGRFHISRLGNFLRISDVTEMDNNLPVKCVARNSVDLKGVAEGVLRVIVPKPTANVAATSKGALTTVPPEPGVTKTRKGYDRYPSLGTGGNNGVDIGNKGVGAGGGRGKDGTHFGRYPERPFQPRDPRPSASFGFFTAKPNGGPTIKQRAFDGPLVTYHMSNNDFEKINAPPRVNMTVLVGGATGLLLIVLIVLFILILVVRKSNSSKPAPVKSARNRNLRPYSTGTLSKSDIFVLPVPSSEDDERDISNLSVLTA